MALQLKFHWLFGRTVQVCSGRLSCNLIGSIEHFLFISHTTYGEETFFISHLTVLLCKIHNAIMNWDTTFIVLYATVMLRLPAHSAGTRSMQGKMDNENAIMNWDTTFIVLYATVMLRLPAHSAGTRSMQGKMDNENDTRTH